MSERSVFPTSWPARPPPPSRRAPRRALARRADLSRGKLEAEDLTAVDVLGLQPGDVVSIAFDAIPDLSQTGTVARVRPIGEDLRGDIVYTLVIDPDQQDSRLLWNLTAVVTIDPM